MIRKRYEEQVQIRIRLDIIDYSINNFNTLPVWDDLDVNWRTD